MPFWLVSWMTSTPITHSWLVLSASLGHSIFSTDSKTTSIFQIIQGTATTFGCSLVSLYSLYQRFSTQNEFYAAISSGAVLCTVSALTEVIAGVYNATRVCKEVRSHFKQTEYEMIEFESKSVWYQFWFWQGKKTAQILHGIINRCTDSEITSSVCNILLLYYSENEKIN